MLPQNAPDLQAAVAASGILFDAQESYTELAETPFQAYEAFLKQRRIGHAIVEDMPFGVVKLGPQQREMARNLFPDSKDPDLEYAKNMTLEERKRGPV